VNSRRRIDRISGDIKTGVVALLRDKGMEGTCLLSMWCPVYRERDSSPGFRTELENLAGDAKGKDTSGQIHEVEITDAPTRGGLLRSSDDAR
jgi:hypothetical protein